MRDRNDPEMFAIRNSVSYIGVCDFFHGKEIGDMRLPLNNRKAFEYLSWLNQYYDQNNYLNYIINTFSMMYGDEIFDKIKEPSKPDYLNIIRPPTINEEIVALSKIIANAPYDDNHNFTIEVNARILSDAVYYLNCLSLFESGIAAAFTKFGTWEDNPVDFNFKTFEEDIENDKE